MARAPDPFQKYSVLPQSRVEELARKIKQEAERLSDDETTLLGEIYLRTGIAVDQFLSQPDHLSKFAKQFNKKAGRQIEEDRLLALLLRLRKQGRLPRLAKLPKPVQPVS